MSTVQKIIKYLSIAFAISLVFAIVSGIVGGLSLVSNIFDNDKSKTTEKLEGIDITDNILILDVNVKNVSINIKDGEKLKAETNNKYITVNEKDNKLLVTEKSHNFNRNNDTTLTIYVPNDLVFDAVLVETGAGKINIDKLSAKRIDFELGAGTVDINNLDVQESAKIEGGAGKISILNGSINNLDLDMGVGKLNLKSKITGSSDIETDVGSLDLDLIGIEDDYKISVEKGLGSINISGNNIDNNSIYGTGLNKINVEGGVGSINIDFINER